MLLKKFLEQAGLDWSGAPYQTANAKILDQHHRSDRAVKFTENQIGAIMCAFAALGEDVLASVDEIEVTAFNLAAAKVSVAANNARRGFSAKLPCQALP